MWKDKKVIVTGGAGFVGSYLCPMLVKAGARVIAMDNLSRGQNHDVKGVKYVNTDVSSFLICQQVFDGAYAVFNLAAGCGGVYFNMSHQLEQLLDNIKLQTAPVEAAVLCEVERFLQVSSVCIYPNEFNDPAKEENGFIGEPESANAGYSWAKRIGEIATHLAFENTDTHYVIVRPTNMYGERDYYDDKAHVIPALIKKFTGTTLNNTITVYGKDRSREFMHAEDGARGMLHALEMGRSGEVYNLGTDGHTRITIGALAEAIRGIVGSTARIDFREGAGDMSRSTDTAKARLDFGWMHYIDLAKGLCRTVEGYNCNDI